MLLPIEHYVSFCITQSKQKKNSRKLSRALRHTSFKQCMKYEISFMRTKCFVELNFVSFTVVRYFKKKLLFCSPLFSILLNMSTKSFRKLPLSLHALRNIFMLSFLQAPYHQILHLGNL